MYIDPVSQYADFRALPRADLILVTHEHADHLDPAAIAALKSKSTLIILSESARKKSGEGQVLDPSRKIEVASITVEATPAYNTTPGRTVYHPKERRDNGYILTIGRLRIQRAIQSLFLK